MMKPYTTLLRYLRERHIEYHCQNYLTLEGNALFDVVTLIYCDFGILPPSGLDGIAAAHSPRIGNGTDFCRHRLHTGK